MNENAFTISKVNWDEAKAALQLVRRRVFIEEQSVPEDLEWDDHDKDCVHILTYNDKSEPIATARVLINGHIGRMAVLKEYRNLGVGSAMLDKLIEYCKQYNLQPHLDAQTVAIGFYERKGFKTTSEIFIDAGIPHKHMKIEES